MNLTNHKQLKHKKSIFRKIMVVFVLAVLVPTAMLGLKNYRVFSEQVQQMVEARVLSGKEAQKQLYDRKVQILTYEGYGLAITMVLGYFLASSIVQPIRTLQKGARRIGNGYLDFRVETDTEDELEELAATINQMAASLQVRQEELGQRNWDMSLLYEVAHGMSECRELDDALGLAIDKAMGVIKSGASAGCILLKNKDGAFDALACRTAASDICSDSAIRTFKQAASEANQAGTRSLFIASDNGADGSFEAFVCIPMKIEGNFKGAVCIAGEKTNFTGPAMELLSAIGSEIAIALENARLFSEMEKQKRELAMATIEIANLINRAEKNKSFGVRYRNPNLRNCWEAKKCEVFTCPAHGSGNSRCWQIAGTLCDEEVQGTFAEKIDKCEKCSVYQAACPDRITTVGETFNNMMAVLEGKVKEQEELQRQLYNSSKLAAIGELAAGVAHEINNPQTGILANTMLL
ncbi:MAG: HAMP domain-containing protein, partial [Actinomycetota bacterium]